MTDEWEFMEYCKYYMGPNTDQIKVDIYCDECLVGRYVVFKIVSTDYLGEGNNALLVKEVKVYGREVIWMCILQKQLRPTYFFLTFKNYHYFILYVFALF